MVFYILFLLELYLPQFISMMKMVGNPETVPVTKQNDESQFAGSLLPFHQSYVLCICVQLLSFPRFVR